MPVQLRRFSALLILAFLTCKDSNAPLPDEPGTPTDIAGSWAFYEVLTDSARGIICHDHGTVVIAQNGGDLAGDAAQDGSCVVNGEGVDNSGTASMSGKVGSATIRMVFGDCDYRGDLFNTPTDSLAGTVTCTVSAGSGVGRVTLGGTWWAIKPDDHVPPTLNADMIFPAGDVMYVVGETLRVAINASDDRKLHSLVYDIGPPMNVHDSIPLTGTAFTDTIQMAIPPSWEGESDVFMILRDAIGSGQFQTVGTLRVLNGIRRPFQSRNLIARAAGAVYDPVRDVMYLAQAESAQVGTLALSAMTLLPRVRLPITARDYGTLGIDIVPGGDSVVVALPDSARLAVVNPQTGTVATAPITGDVDGTTNVVVASNRHALVLGSRDSAGFVYFGVWDHDLVTGSDTLRRDIGLNGHLNATTQMFRSPDQSKILVYSIGAPACGYLYDAATGTFSTCKTFSSPGVDAVASASTNGAFWLWGDVLLDGALNVIDTIPNPTGYTYPGIAPDGSAAYVPTLFGYNKIALPSMAVVERVRIPWPFPLTRATVFPDGNRLLIWSDLIHGMKGMYRAIVVDLQ